MRIPALNIRCCVLCTISERMNKRINKQTIRICTIRLLSLVFLFSSLLLFFVSFFSFFHRDLYFNKLSEMCVCVYLEFTFCVYTNYNFFFFAAPLRSTSTEYEYRFVIILLNFTNLIHAFLNVFAFLVRTTYLHTRQRRIIGKITIYV